jgi:hypothetical protein
MAYQLHIYFTSWSFSLVQYISFMMINYNSLFSYAISDCIFYHNENFLTDTLLNSEFSLHKSSGMLLLYLNSFVDK